MKNINMIGPRVLNKILKNIYGTSFITIYHQNILKNIIILKHLFHPKYLNGTISNSNVFSLYGRQRYRVLLFSIPRNQIVSEIKTVTSSIFSIISISYPICITKSYKTSICIFSKPYTILSSTINIPDDPLYCSKMWLLRITLISCTYTNTKTNVKSTSS